MLTIADVAAMFDRRVGTVEQWRAREKMPDPDVQLGRTPGWHRDTLLRWGRQTGRLDADGRPAPWGRGRPRNS